MTSLKQDLVVPLDIQFADNLPETFIAPDELVEGIIVNGESSILYGPSNSGKTFLAIHMACSVARGVEWLGRKTEQGIVLYLAAESPASVQSRLQAYQQHYGVRVPNFVIVRSSINLFESDADTRKIIETVNILEKEMGMKVRLIVGDTLARLTAKANENTGQDMGVVIRHIDLIRKECRVHFMLIHHTGKNLEAGARGWSGMRAAVDTEIEIADLAAGRCAEITKQRDLNTNGERIGFVLENIELGKNKWGKMSTSCVVVPIDAPLKISKKRQSDAQKDILDYLKSSESAVRKIDLVKRFKKGRSTTIYRQIQALVEAEKIVEDKGGMLSLISVEGVGAK